jgi:hypothetical protein
MKVASIVICGIAASVICLQCPRTVRAQDATAVKICRTGGTGSPDLGMIVPQNFTKDNCVAYVTRVAGGGRAQLGCFSPQKGVLLDSDANWNFCGW